MSELKLKTQKTYAKKWIIYSVLTYVAYFAPYVVAVLCLLPVLTESTGTKLLIGGVLIVINLLPFVFGLLRNLFNKRPFTNFLSVLIVLAWAFFSLEIFQRYVFSVVIIEVCAFVGGEAANTFHQLAQKAKTNRQTAKTLKEMGK